MVCGSTGGFGGKFDPKTSSNGVFADAAAFNQKVKVLFLGIGSMEGPNTKNFSDQLTKAGYQEHLFRIAWHRPRVAGVAPVSERLRAPAC
jgi:hypothetical protein